MSNGLFTVPPPVNEPVRSYAPGTPERDRLKAELGRQLADAVEVPLWIGGKPVRTGKTAPLAIPHDRSRTLGTFHQASAADVRAAIAAAQAAKPAWAALPWEERAAIFLRAATLLQGEFRDRLNAATMLGQSKTAHQAEIDAACELIDFFRFNVAFYARILADQPISPDGVWNRLDYRPLDGYVFAVTPFNFTSIAGNLPSAPALCGNTVIWKPASTAVHSGAVIMELFGRAGLPPGVINFLPGSGAQVGEPAIADADLAGVHFTGSTPVFKAMWKTIGNNIDRYRAYPRLCGETGGKDFVFAHASADVESLAQNLLRGAFEYQGQKCSAASRAYVPASLWPALRERLADGLASMSVGDVTDFRNFMGAVIDAASYRKLSGAIEEARGKIGGAVAEILGGRCDDARGFFIHPTVIVVNDPGYRTMCEELFGPILTLLVYDDARFEETLDLCDRGAEYALTGAVFAEDRAALRLAEARLRFAAGNFYLNDKPTGAVVGQQPFGGSRASGTNDKAGSILNLQRWISPRTIKETFAPLRDYRYPFLGQA
ncbi:MAG TPA: L-glutamate gamma-semialdehyde dehydrogenase [Nannocystaceae bacterium]|nr:L-glutamate gamma-semialdehyde dehydrogenase [Nannocystaceae bacterium]